jgi:hypothetical protein
MAVRRKTIELDRAHIAAYSTAVHDCSSDEELLATIQKV